MADAIESTDAVDVNASAPPSERLWALHHVFFASALFVLSLMARQDMGNSALLMSLLTAQLALWTITCVLLRSPDRWLSYTRAKRWWLLPAALFPWAPILALPWLGLWARKQAFFAFTFPGIVMLMYWLVQPLVPRRDASSESEWRRALRSYYAPSIIMLLWSIFVTSSRTSPHPFQFPLTALVPLLAFSMLVWRYAEGLRNPRLAVLLPLLFPILIYFHGLSWQFASRDIDGTDGLIALIMLPVSGWMLFLEIATHGFVRMALSPATGTTQFMGSLTPEYELAKALLLVLSLLTPLITAIMPTALLIWIGVVANRRGRRMILLLLSLPFLFVCLYGVFNWSTGAIGYSYPLNWMLPPLEVLLPALVLVAWVLWSTAPGALPVPPFSRRMRRCLIAIALISAPSIALMLFLSGTISSQYTMMLFREKAREKQEKQLEAAKKDFIEKFGGTDVPLNIDTKQMNLLVQDIAAGRWQSIVEYLDKHQAEVDHVEQQVSRLIETAADQGVYHIILPGDSEWWRRTGYTYFVLTTLAELHRAERLTDANRNAEALEQIVKASRTIDFASGMDAYGRVILLERRNHSIRQLIRSSLVLQEKEARIQSLELIAGVLDDTNAYFDASIKAAAADERKIFGLTWPVRLIRSESMYYDVELQYHWTRQTGMLMLLRLHIEYLLWRLRNGAFPSKPDEVFDALPGTIFHQPVELLGTTFGSGVMVRTRSPDWIDLIWRPSRPGVGFYFSVNDEEVRWIEPAETGDEAKGDPDAASP